MKFKLKSIDTQYISKRDIITSSVEHQKVYSFINNKLINYSSSSDAFRLGYEVLGPLIYGFCQWIHRQANSCQLNKLFFLARDGYLIQKAYRVVYGNSAIPSEYVYFSRTSLRIPYILQTGRLSNLQHTMTRKQYEIQDLLSALGLKFDEYADLFAEYGLSRDSLLDPADIDYYPRLSEALLAGLHKVGLSTYDYLRQYLNQINMHGRVGIVDVGWHGTIQKQLDCILQSFDPLCKTVGLYCGYAKRRNTLQTVVAHGYWFSTENEDDVIDMFRATTLLETLLFPQTGTTLGYRKHQGGIGPILGDAEKLPWEWLNEFQNGAMQFVSDYKEYGPEIGIMSPEVSRLPFFNMACLPRMKEAQTIGHFQFEDVTYTRIAAPRQWMYYLFHPKALRRDYSNAIWKEAFIKQLLPWCSLKLLKKCYALLKLLKDLFTDKHGSNS